MTGTAVAAAPEAAATTRFQCHGAGCGRCCACGQGAPGNRLRNESSSSELRLIAFPVRGEKRWLCPACLTAALSAARPATP